MTEFRKFLVPLDGSPWAERILPLADWLARRTGAQIVLVRAAEAHVMSGIDPSEAQVEVVQEAERYLEEVRARLEPVGVAVDQAVPYGAAAESILMEINLREPDLVAMVTHGRSGVRRFALGSVAL